MKCIIKIPKPPNMFPKYIPHIIMLSPHNFSFLWDRKKHIDQTYFSSQDSLSKLIPKLIHYEFQKFQKWIINEFQFTQAALLDETHLDAVRGFIELRGFHPSASTSGTRRSDAATSDKDKQICFMLMPRTWFNMEGLRLE